MRFFIFALFFGITCSLPGMCNEKGIRCNTGAVPAAVSPIKVSDSNATAPIVRDGKVQITGQARRPAAIHYYIFCFREK